ncbi:hypothetical protein ACFQDG_17355 [Natronoarchaeum mannanilyticum]|uniref:DUF2975 domain-containing protein n=1 Tax=Natronoarchaeum mannanilyticum TaxID=926360 RepID=A0AAV3T4W7_9EURY
MSESRFRLLTAGAVWVGALLLFAPPTFLGTIWAVEEFLAVAGVSLSAPVRLLVDMTAFLIAVLVATEIAAWRLHGGDWLRRGSRRVRVVRIALAGVVSVGVLAVSGALAVVMASAAASGRYGTVVIGFAAAFGVAFVVSAVRIGREFRRGYQDRDASRRLS